MCNVFGTQSLFGLIKSAFLVSNVTAFIFNLCVAGEKEQCAPILFVLETARLLCNSGQPMRTVIVNEVIRLMRIMKWSTSPVGAW
jgi:hypothetical protein